MKLQFTSTPKVFTNENGQSVDYIERCIIIDGISYRINKLSGQVFDFQFKDYINGDPVEVEVVE